MILEIIEEVVEFVLWFFADIVCYSTGEILLFVGTGGRHQMRRPGEADTRGRFDILSQVSFWVGAAFWVGVAIFVHYLLTE